MEKQTEGLQVEEQQNVDHTESQEFSNSDWKAHPLTQKLTSELSQLKAAQAEIAEREKKQAREAEIKKATEKEQFSEAVKVYEKQIEEMESKYKKDLLHRDLGFKLALAGFQNDKFIKGAIADYDSDKFENPSAYVDALLSDESNKPFLANAQAVPGVPGAPGKPSVSGSGPMTREKIKAMQKSDDPKERAAVRKYLTEYFEKHGALPASLREG
jgi:hypothetical protein